MSKILIVGILISIILYILLSFQTKEHFYFSNILPTELIDPDYRNINEDVFNYYNWKRVGDIHGVDLNCNNVSVCDLLKWMQNDDSSVLHEYVYRFDPSVDIDNPIDSPRILKMLLRNLPEKHRYLSILRKCFPMKVRVA